MSSDLEYIPARGGRKPSNPIPYFEVVRELTLEDLALRQRVMALGSSASNGGALPPGTAAKPPALIRGEMRAAHHQLAQLVARGASGAEMQLTTGYSQSYISNIKQHDPAFQELVAYYKEETKDLYIDALSIMRDAGVAAAEELRSRLRAEAPTNDFTKRELLEVVDTTINKPMSSVANARRGVDPLDSARGSIQPSIVNIKFVQAQPQTITVEHEP